MMRFYDILLALTVAFIWGVNFVAAKIGLHHFPPLFFMGLRFLVVAVVLLPFVGKSILPLRTTYILSLTYGVAYHGLLFTGVWMGLDIATSVIALQLNVPFTSLLSVVFLKDRIGWRRITGMMIAFAGIITMVGSPDILDAPLAFLLVILAAFCWALFNVHLKQLGPVPIMNFLAWISVFTAPQLFILSWLIEGNQLPTLLTMGWMESSALFYTSILSTIVGFALWSYLLRHYSVNQVAPFSMLMPFFGVLSAVLMLDEQLTWLATIGGLMTLTGVAIITIRRPLFVTRGAVVS